jgi:hypothetical protein
VAGHRVDRGRPARGPGWRQHLHLTRAVP